MRALWICDYFPRPHDRTTGVWAFETIRGLQRQGCHVTALAPTPWIPRAAVWPRVLRSWASVPPTYTLGEVAVWAPRCLHYPHRLVAHHLYRRWPALDTELVWRGCRPAIDRLVRRESFDVVHANFIFPSGYLGWRIKRDYGIPVVMHERSPLRLAAAMSHPSRRALYARLVREADALITLNRQLAGDLRRLSRRSVHVIPAGADPTAVRASAAPRPPQYAKSLVVLSVGAFIPRKGQDVLVDAVHRLRSCHPNLKIIMIGEGPTRRAVERQIGRLGLERCIEIWGRRPHDEVLAAMSWCDIFALPSWNEAFGTVYAEAMACARPVIACQGEGIADVAQDGVNVRLVRRGDAASLAETLRQLLQDVRLSRHLGQAARDLAEQQLSYAAIASQILGVYQDVVV